MAPEAETPASHAVPAADTQAADEDENESARVIPAVIAGGGIAGLVLALSLRTRLGITPVVYEQAPEFRDGVGGAIGMYANGLRVIRDADDDGRLLSRLREAGYEYVWRRWYDHDGREVCKAEERHLVGKNEDEDVEELQSIGIRRWKLQRILYEVCVERGIPVHFGRRVESVAKLPDGSGAVEIGFAGSCGETVRTSLLFGCDGVNSKVQKYVLGENASQEQPEYTGVTCLMGASPIPSPERGICFPSSNTTKCHMCTYPTGPNETIFQMYFPTPVENPEAWGALGEEGGKKERDDLAAKMMEHGWSERFVRTVAEAEPSSIVRVGLRAREPLSRWVRGNVVLLGDAAHPPVPYIGQGAMMAVEDAGTLSLLLQKMCKCAADDDSDSSGSKINLKSLPEALRLYQSLRVPRTASVLGKSRVLGKAQQDRAESRWYAAWREAAMKLQVLWHGTLPIMMQGPRYDYRKGVEEALERVGTNGDVRTIQKEEEEGGVLGCGGQVHNAGKKDALEALTVTA